jgi:hypothetical protein
LPSHFSTGKWPGCLMEIPHSDSGVYSRFTSGPFISLFAAPTAQMGDPRDFGRRLGLQTTFMAFGTRFKVPCAWVRHLNHTSCRSFGWPANLWSNRSKVSNLPSSWHLRRCLLRVPCVSFT